MECMEYNYENNRSKAGKEVSKLSDKERFERNRRRRLMKEQEDRQKKEKTKCQKSPHTCLLCQRELVLPVRVYICQEGHLHREGLGGEEAKKVNL